jgi:hypothetical protein
MSAGLPGVGLSGLFFIVSALLMLPLEIVHTVRGRSSRSRWATVLRHFVTALAMLAALELFYAGVRYALQELSKVPISVHGALTGGGSRAAASSVHMMPVLPVLFTACLVLCIVGLAKSAELVSRRMHARGTRRGLEG